MSEEILQSYPLTDFYDLTFEERYVVDPLLPVGSIGLVHGKGGHGKTQFAFALMNAITTGGNFLDRYPCAEGGVLYLQFDMPTALFQERLLKARPATDAPEQIVVVAHKPIDITEARYQLAISDLVDLHQPSLVIVDTLRKVHRFDENDNAVPSIVYEAWKDSVGEDTSVLIIHHDRKSPPFSNGESSEDDPIESFRGARAWIDDSDLGIHLYKYRRKNKVKMDFSKLRCAPQDPMNLRLNANTLLIEPRGPESVAEWIDHIMRTSKDISTTTLVERVARKAGCTERTVYNKLSERTKIAS